MSDIQYIHRRQLTMQGSPASRGGFTVAYKEITPGVIEYSIASCSTNDNFNKALGRAISAGRLVNKKSTKCFGVTVPEFRDMWYMDPV